MTSDLRDFPRRAVAPYGIKAQSPDDFLCALLDAFPQQMPAIIAEQVASLKRSPKAPEDVLAAVGLIAPQFASRMRRLIRRPGR